MNCFTFVSRDVYVGTASEVTFERIKTTDIFLQTILTTLFDTDLLTFAVNNTKDSCCFFL